jgi:serine/threonine-protein kinase
VQGRLIGGRYEVVRKIAEGGMGVVYEAQHNLSKKNVALKVLFPHIGRDENARQRFMREVAAPAQIGHDGIVEVYDAGFDPNDGSLFVAMELLRGETLRDRLARGGQTREGVLDLFEQLLDPLAAAHVRGIVHRDLKPENVYIHRLRDGREVVKLLDFGIARDLEPSATNVTQTGVAMGTPHYMAPEQAMSARGVSFPADVWAVGAMLYEAMSGKTPFAGETASAIVVHACTKAHDPLARVAPATPAAIADLVDRCLSKEAEKRPANAGALLGELRAARGKNPGIQTGVVTNNPMAAISPIAAPSSVATSAPGYGTGPAQYGYGTGPQVATSPGNPLATPGARPTASPHPAPYGAAPASQAQYGTSPPLPAAQTPYAQTPPPSTSSVAASGRSGMGMRIAMVAVGVLALGTLGFVALAAIVGASLYASTREAGTGTVHVVSLIPGELWVDDAPRGPMSFGGQTTIEVSADEAHRIEIRGAGITLASADVTVSAGEMRELDLRPGMFATGPAPGGGGQVLTGALAPGDRTLSSGEYMDYYEFTWTAGQTVDVELSSPVFDTYLILRFPSGLQRDNDDARGTDSMLQMRLEETGTYRVIVTSYSPGETGPYTLTIR